MNSETLNLLPITLNFLLLIICSLKIISNNNRIIIIDASWSVFTFITLFYDLKIKPVSEIGYIRGMKV